MDKASLLALTHNAALLIAMVFIYDLATRRRGSRHKQFWKVSVGIALGLIGMTIMLTPWEYEPGLIFDTRSVLLGISGLFFGTIPTVVAMAMTATLRFFQGGSYYTGCSVILASGGIGLIWRHWRHGRVEKISGFEFYLFGHVVHAAMLLLMFTLPVPRALQVLSTITLPVLLIYPTATAMLGLLLAGRFQHLNAEKSLRENEFVLRSQFEVGNIGLAIISPDQHWLRVNPRLCEILGYEEAELQELTWAEMTYPEDLEKDLTQFHRLLAGEIDRYELDKRFIRKDAEIVFTHLSVAAYRNDGRVQFIVAGLLDNTEAKRIEAKLRASEEQLQLVLTGSDLGFWDWNIATGVVQRNARWAEMLGYTFEEIRTSVKQWIDFVHPDDRDAAWQSIADHLAGKTAQHNLEYRMLTKDGGFRWILDCAKIVSYSPDGKPLRMCGTHTDITERKRSEESMRLATLVYQNTSEGMAVTDASGKVISINPAFTEITGYTPEDIIGTNSRLLISEGEDPIFYENLWETIDKTGSWRGELQNRRKDGSTLVVQMTVNTIFNAEGRIDRRVTLFSDITEKKESEEIIWNQANFDPLTGLPNRRLFIEQLQQEIKKAFRSGQQIALLFLDLDLFKEVNDTLGHDMGDILLKEAALRLRGSVRESDMVSRLGGDEFTVVLSGLDSPDSAERVSQSILRKLSEPFQLGEQKAYISASIGITLFPDDADNVETLLKNADQAMYAAKNQGRNRFNYFTPCMQEAARNRMQLVTDLRDALSGQQFRLYYQPIVELSSGRILKAEALLRWHHPSRGLVSPAEFIPISEDTGMIVEIGDWVFREAAQQVARWRSVHGTEIQVSINKSPRQFRDELKPTSEWFDYLQGLGLNGDAITVEITEGLLLEAAPYVSDKLLAFRDAGMQVSLDDFGTGYSSLSYLKKFDIDYLKIDQSFIQNLQADSHALALCEAIIVMAHKLDMQVIAEGVETQQQLDLLSSCGCDFAQGYLFSRPVPEEEFAQQFLAKSICCDN